MFCLTCTAATEIYTDGHLLSPRGALSSYPSYRATGPVARGCASTAPGAAIPAKHARRPNTFDRRMNSSSARAPEGHAIATPRPSQWLLRSDEHTSCTPVTNAQLVCRLLPAKKKHTLDRIRNLTSMI